MTRVASSLRFASLFVCGFLLFSVSGHAQTWTRLPGTDHWYRRDTNFQPQPWHVSNSASQGATLATFETLEENIWVTGSVGDGDGDWAWIGLYQDVNDPTYAEPGDCVPCGWKWWGGASITYTNWDTGNNDPSNSGTEGQQCAVADRAGSEALWGDAEYWRPYEAVYEIVSGDCDGNGMPDAYEFATGAASDANGNGIIDECELAWVRRPGTDHWYVRDTNFQPQPWHESNSASHGANLATFETLGEN